MSELVPTLGITPEELRNATLLDASGVCVAPPAVASCVRLLSPFAEQSGNPTVHDDQQVQKIQDILLSLSSAVSWRQELEMRADPLFPGADFPVTLALPTNRRVKVRGVVRHVSRGRRDLALSDAEFAGMGWIEGEDE